MSPENDSSAAPLPDESELRPTTDPITGIDLSLIRENLKLTPWERLLANDDAINFIEMARAALKAQNASPKNPFSEIDRS